MHDHDHEITAAGCVQPLAAMLDYKLPMSMSAKGLL